MSGHEVDGGGVEAARRTNGLEATTTLTAQFEETHFTVVEAVGNRTRIAYSSFSERDQTVDRSKAGRNGT